LSTLPQTGRKQIGGDANWGDVVGGEKIFRGKSGVRGRKAGFLLIATVGVGRLNRRSKI